MNPDPYSRGPDGKEGWVDHQIREEKRTFAALVIGVVLFVAAVITVAALLILR